MAVSAIVLQNDVRGGVIAGIILVRPNAVLDEHAFDTVSVVGRSAVGTGMLIRSTWFFIAARLAVSVCLRFLDGTVCIYTGRLRPITGNRPIVTLNDLIAQISLFAVLQLLQIELGGLVASYCNTAGLALKPCFTAEFL